MTDEKRKKIEDAARVVYRQRERILQMRMTNTPSDPAEKEQAAVNLMIAEGELRDAEYALYCAQNYYVHEQLPNPNIKKDFFDV